MTRTVLIGGVVALLAALSGGPAAHAATVTSVSMYSDPADFIGGGVQRVFHPGNTTDLGAKVDVDSVLVWAVGGPYDEGYSFRFVAPYGAPLERRNYVAAQRSGFIDPGYPGMDVEGEGRGCNAILGNFEVRDIQVGPQGSVERLWLVYEQHCEGNTAATWGEIRINAWVPDAQAATVPGIVRWPAQDSWEQATAVPVTYRGGSAIESAAVVGPHAADYSETAGGCLGHAGPCDVVVRFARTAPGTRRATLRLTDAEGRVHETALEGFAHDGATDAELEVLAGDVAGQPGTYRYDSTSAFFAGQNYGAEVNVFLDGDDGRHYLGRFGTGSSTPLAPGSYPDADNLPAGRPFLDVWGTPTGCNRTGGSFTVHSIERMPDETLRSLDVSFELLCYQDHRPALRGRWRWRADAAVPLAPWLVPGPRPPIDAPPVDPDPPGSGGPGGQTPVASGGQAAAPVASAGTAAILRPVTVSARIDASWRVGRRFTRVRRLVVRRLPAGAAVRLRCSGRCAFRRRSVPVRRDRADAGRRLTRARFRPGTVLEVRVARAGATGRVVRYTMRRGRRPAVTRLCLPPGASRPARCAA